MILQRLFGAAILFCLVACQPVTPNELVAINQRAFTDVCYAGQRDSVWVSTYDGYILHATADSQWSEVAHLNDEIYSLQYIANNGHLLASTFRTGILVINPDNGQVAHRLTLTKWINELKISADQQYVFGTNVAGDHYLWDASREYAPHLWADTLTGGRLAWIDAQQRVFVDGRGTVRIYQLPTETWLPNYPVDEGSLVTFSSEQIALFIDRDTATVVQDDAIAFHLTNPDWPFPLSTGDTARIPYQLSILDGLLTSHRVVTVGLDRSVRFWDAASGELIATKVGHSATVHRVVLSPDGTQVATIDLKGNLRFHDL